MLDISVILDVFFFFCRLLQRDCLSYFLIDHELDAERLLAMGQTSPFYGS